MLACLLPGWLIFCLSVCLCACLPTTSRQKLQEQRRMKVHSISSNGLNLIKWMKFNPNGSKFNQNGSKFNPNGSKFNPNGSKFNQMDENLI